MAAALGGGKKLERRTRQLWPGGVARLTGVDWHEADGGVERAHRLGVPGRLVQRIAAVMVRVGVGRQHAQHAVVDAERLIEVARVLQGEAEVGRDRELVLSLCADAPAGPVSSGPGGRQRGRVTHCDAGSPEVIAAR